MSEETNDFTIQALVEANELLQEEVTRLRKSHSILRKVISTLRATLTTYRDLLKIAQYNDETFKSLCSGEFDAPVALDAKGGLPEASGAVEPTIASVEEASASGTSC